jgi:glutamate formiminotransferase
MEIYSAISDFKSPDTDGSQNILSFKKGDTFEVFDCNKTSGEWWGARAVINNIVGYVPSKYMKVCIYGSVFCY